MKKQANSPLPEGFDLCGYTIKRQISLGGFSIVYSAYDAQGQLVAIKEYLPNSVALRNEGEIRPVIFPEQEAAFRYGLKCFFEEGRVLSMLSHPNIIRVLHFFCANDTVYMVMPYERGLTLHDVILKDRYMITEKFMRNVFTKVLNGLREVHSNKLLHLDFKPANLYIRKDRNPVLIDFGAARQTLNLEMPMLKPTYTPGFASPEHYEHRERLGPWSDIYSVGASMYACMAGEAPQAADSRIKKDRLIPAMVLFGGKYSDQLLEIVDWCLNLNYLDRPQSVFELQAQLVDDYDVPAHVSAESYWKERLETAMTRKQVAKE